MSDLMQFEDIKTICRGDSNVKAPLISDVLSFVMSTEVEDCHPKGICPECLNHVKLAYNLKLQFEKSQEILQKYEKSIIASYIGNDVFEVYELSDNSCEFEHNSNNSFKIEPEIDVQFETVDDNIKVESYEILSNNEFSDVEYEEDEYCLTSLNNSADSKPINVSLENEKGIFIDQVVKTVDENNRNPDEKTPLRIKLEENNRNSSNIQVRCVDVNKFIIEQKEVPKDTSNGQCNLPSNNCLNLRKVSTTCKLKCTICGNHYSKGRLKNHVTHCKKLKISTLTCKECQKVFKKIKYLNYHTKLKHTANPPLFPCKVCDSVCRTKSARRVHIRREHGGKRSCICDICGKGFYYNAALLRHKSKHTKEVQEICNVCGKSFHYKGALFYHMKIHTNDRKYLCNFCEKTFYTSQSLQRHIDTHTGERRFKCKFCDKSFRSSSERGRHELIHTGEKPHLCSYCDKGFTSKYNHDIHVAAHKGLQPCGFCNKTFLNSDVLRLHLKLKHKVNLEELNIDEEEEEKTE